MDKKAYYGGLKVEQLKKLLKEKNAKVTGRKSELVDRLLFYDKNDDFGYVKVAQDNVIETPTATNYKDINSSSPIPAFTQHHLTTFLNTYDKTTEKADRMYNNGFLKFIRYCHEDTLYFIKGGCKAEMKKYMQYIVDISTTMDGEIQDSTCDCPVGRSKEAHCKQVLTVLLAVIDFRINNKIILEETCTQQLQTFHQPKIKYNGSLMKAEKFQRRIPAPICNYEDDDDYKIWYQNYFTNLVVSRGFNSDMSIKQIVEPANTYAVE